MKKGASFETLKARYPEYKRGLWSTRETFFGPGSSSDRKNAEVELARHAQKVIEEEEEGLLEAFVECGVQPSVFGPLKTCILKHSHGMVALLNELFEFFPGLIVLQFAIKEKLSKALKSEKYRDIYKRYKKKIAEILHFWCAQQREKGIAPPGSTSSSRTST